jgi:hypothetical protein
MLCFYFFLFYRELLEGNGFLVSWDLDDTILENYLDVALSCVQIIAREIHTIFASFFQGFFFLPKKQLKKIFLKNLTFPKNNIK